MPTPVDIAPARGKLGILLVGLGAVSTTTIAGVLAIRKGLAKPIGSLTQMGTVRLGKRTEGRFPKIKDVMPLAGLDDLVFGGWDIFEDDCYAAAKHAGVIEPSLLDQVRPELEKIRPMPAVFDQRYVKRRYSTNILGNRDGEVLDDPESFKTKEESKKSALDYIFQPQVYPDLYQDLTHVVRINYYPPRGDNKEGWDNIDIVGWLGYPMQIKVNFLCRDSILAAPIVLDLALFMDLAGRAEMRGIQEWLSFYFKAPVVKAGLSPEHDLSVQLLKLENTLRFFTQEELINHLGLTYYGVDEGE